jgi:hypothetical protein
MIYDLRFTISEWNGQAGLTTDARRSGPGSNLLPGIGPSRPSGFWSREGGEGCEGQKSYKKRTQRIFEKSQ